MSGSFRLSAWRESCSVTAARLVRRSVPGRVSAGSDAAISRDDAARLAKPAVSRPRRDFWLRVLLAGPLVLLCATLVMAGGAIWLPKGAAQIDNLLLPILLFPAIWAALFFYACLERRLPRAYGVTGVLALLQLALIGAHALLP